MSLCEQTDEYNVCSSDDAGKMQKRKVEREKDNGTAEILKTKGEMTLEVCMVSSYNTIQHVLRIIVFPVICRTRYLA